MFSLLADLQKERGFPHPSRKKQLLKFKRESTCLMDGWRPSEIRPMTFCDPARGWKEKSLLGYARRIAASERIKSPFNR
jgi:hypothetical protein